MTTASTNRPRWVKNSISSARVENSVPHRKSGSVGPTLAMAGNGQGNPEASRKSRGTSNTQGAAAVQTAVDPPATVPAERARCQAGVLLPVGADPRRRGGTKPIADLKTAVVLDGGSERSGGGESRSSVAAGDVADAADLAGRKVGSFGTAGSAARAAARFSRSSTTETQSPSERFASRAFYRLRLVAASLRPEWDWSGAASLQQRERSWASRGCSQPGLPTNVRKRNGAVSAFGCAYDDCRR